MLDEYKTIKGHLIVELFDVSGNLIDKFDEHNMIMDNARLAMATLMSVVDGSSGITKFVLGTEGHQGTDILLPKDGNTGFTSDRSQLFSEESSGYTYPIVFTAPASASGDCTIVSEPDSGSNVNRTQAGTDVTYTIDIPPVAANDTGYAIFTEAALYADALIFSMKTFRGKIKDNTNSLRVTWTISF